MRITIPKSTFIHPEQLPDEEFCTNVGPETDLARIGWKTKRVGTFAYDINGKVVNGLKPVFVSGEDAKTLRSLKDQNTALLGNEMGFVE